MFVAAVAGQTFRNFSDPNAAGRGTLLSGMLVFWVRNQILGNFLELRRRPDVVGRTDPVGISQSDFN